MQLVHHPDVTATVIALRPAVLSAAKSNPGSATDWPVTYQSVPTLPKFSNWIDPFVWARASIDAVRCAVRNRKDDMIIDAHFLYPDGVAATLIGRSLDIPVVITARGSDVNVKCMNYVMRQWISWSARKSDALITVSDALLRRLQALGIRSPVMCCIPNGVDLDRFKPGNGAIFRKELDVKGEVLLSVGHLVKAKGHHLAIRALAQLPESMLIIAGKGPEEGSLRRLAMRIGVEDRVRFAGAVKPDRMPELYSAADVLILASEREGMPNVILESLACGTPVVSSAAGGIPEVVTSPRAGRCLIDCSEHTIADSVRSIRDAEISCESTRDFARRFSWKDRISEQVALYETVLETRRERVRS